MATLQPVRYGKVVGRLVNIIADGPDEDEFPISGGYPDAVPMTGRVTFTARASRVLVTGAEPAPVTVFSAPVTAQLDENGYLTHNGKRGVFLLAPSVETNPPEWTYTVKYDLQDYEGNAVTHIFDMEIVEYEPGPNPADPDAGSTAVDLTVVTPVSPAPGQAVVVGPPGADGADGDTIVDITLSGDGSALVFHVQRVSGVDLESVDIPALGDLVGAVAVAESARDEAVAAADDATSFAGVAGAAATLAVEKAEEAAGYVGGVADGAISTPKMQDGAVTSAKIADGTIVAADLATGAVTSAKILDGTIVDADISASAAIAGSKLATGGVGTTQLADANVTLAKLAGNSVDSSKIVDASIAAGDLASNAVTTAKILDANVTLAKLATGSVDSSKIVDGSVAAADLASDSVTTVKILDANVTLAKLAGNSVDSSKIVDGSIVNADINPSAAIALSKLATGAVSGSNNGTPTSITIWVGTEAQYAAIGTKDSATLYFRSA